jgi:hypothetical protein
VLVGGTSDDEGVSIVKQIIERTATEIKDDTVETVGAYTFSRYNNLVSVDFPNLTTIGESAFYNCYNLAITTLPSGVTAIMSDAFSGCSKLALTELPSRLTTINATAFKGCSNLRTLTFKGTPTSIVSNSFQNCTNLTTINVPWAEGAVANAPWGATNATINYNYTGG